MKEQVERLVRYLLVLVLILDILSILFPWGTLNYGLYGKADFYSWGVHVKTATGYNRYLLNIFEIDSIFESIVGTGNLKIGVIPTIFGILVLFLPVIVIIFNGILITKNTFSKENIIIILVWSISSIISFYIFVQFGILSSVSTFEYSMGFILIAISIFILIFTHFLFDYFSVEKQISRYESQTPLEILKLRYAKGEISKEEYEDIRREIER